MGFSLNDVTALGVQWFYDDTTQAFVPIRVRRRALKHISKSVTSFIDDPCAERNLKVSICKYWWEMSFRIPSLTRTAIIFCSWIFFVTCRLFILLELLFDAQKKDNLIYFRFVANFIHWFVFALSEFCKIVLDIFFT